MQAHCMLLNINSLKVLNEGQTPDDTYDQPLFALSMEVKHRNAVPSLGYFVLFGTFHIEQSFLGIYEDLIKMSSSLEIMNHPNFTTIGLSSLAAKPDVSSINP